MDHLINALLAQFIRQHYGQVQAYFRDQIARNGFYGPLIDCDMTVMFSHILAALERDKWLVPGGTDEEGDEDED